MDVQYVNRLLAFEVFCQALTFTKSPSRAVAVHYLPCGLVKNRVSDEDHTLITLSATFTTGIRMY